MLKIYEIKVIKCELQCKGVSCCLCYVGVILVIVYGGNVELVVISLDYNEIWLVQQNEWFYVLILDLNLDGQVQKVLLCDMQCYLYKQLIMYLDFQCVNENEVLIVLVLLYFVNEDILLVGKVVDVVVIYELKEVIIICLLKDLLELIEVDLGELKVGDVVYLFDIKLLKGVEILVLVLGKDYDDVIVIVKVGKVDVVDEEVVVVE